MKRPHEHVESLMAPGWEHGRPREGEGIHGQARREPGPVLRTQGEGRGRLNLVDSHRGLPYPWPSDLPSSGYSSSFSSPAILYCPLSPTSDTTLPPPGPLSADNLALYFAGKTETLGREAQRSPNTRFPISLSLCRTLGQVPGPRPTAPQRSRSQSLLSTR